MGRLFALLLLALLCCPSYADDTCAYVFSSGGANPAFQSCVTANGNIAHLTTPFNVENIALGTGGEGYGICDVTNSAGYWDFGSDYSSTPIGLAADSGNWSAPTLLDSSESSVRIRRRTLDHIWTLTQTITQNQTSLKVVMALKNNSTTDRVVNLIRFADVTVAGFALNNFDATLSSAFGWNSFGTTVGGSSTPPYGVQLEDAAAPIGLQEALAAIREVNYPPHPCVPGSKFGPLAPTDGSLFMFYGGAVPAHGTATVTMRYSGM